MKLKTFNKIASEGLDLIRENFSGSVISEDVSDPDAILLRSHKLQLEECKGVRAVARAGAGVNNVPVEALSEHGIVVFNTPGANANAVAELTIGAMISEARKMPSALFYFDYNGMPPPADVAAEVEKDKKAFKGQELQNKKLVVVGLGAIGSAVAKLALAFGMRVVGIDPFAPQIEGLETVEDWTQWGANYYSFHVPASPTTKEFAVKVLEVATKDQAIVLNFARGELFDSSSLVGACARGLRRYITDFADNILVESVQMGQAIVCYPHLGASTEEAETNCSVMAATQLCDFFQYGRITNSVNFPELPYIAPERGIVRFVVLHRNIPGVLKRITEYIADGLQANVKDMINRSKGSYAATLIDLDNVAEKPDAAFNTMREDLGDVLGVFRVNLPHQP